MRRINYGQINTSGAGAPYKSGTFEHLLQGQREVDRWIAFSSLYGNLGGQLTPGTPYVLAGMTEFLTVVIPGAMIFDGYGYTSIATYTIAGGVAAGADMTPLFSLEGTSDGVSKTGPEIFILPNTTNTISGSTPVWLCQGTFVGNGTDADPATFSNQVAYSIHQDWYVQIANTPTLNASIVPADIAYQIGTVGSLVYLWQQNPSVYDIYTNQIPAINAAVATINSTWTSAFPTITAVGGTIATAAYSGYPTTNYHKQGKTLNYNLILLFQATSAGVTAIHIPWPSGITKSSNGNKMTSSVIIASTKTNLPVIFDMAANGGFMSMTRYDGSTFANGESYEIDLTLTTEIA
jgi:hypothetical protein